jgi:hypothetical protein
VTDILYPIALIVGAGSGVGALAHGFAEVGLKVGPAARNIEKLVPFTAEAGAETLFALATKPSAGASTAPYDPKRTAPRLSAPSCSRPAARRAWHSVALPALIAQWRAESVAWREGMSTRAADDFEFIRSRMEDLKREHQPAPVQPTSLLPPGDQSDKRPWECDGFCPR